MWNKIALGLLRTNSLLWSRGLTTTLRCGTYQVNDCTSHRLLVCPKYSIERIKHIGVERVEKRHFGEVTINCADRVIELAKEIFPRM